MLESSTIPIASATTVMVSTLVGVTQSVAQPAVAMLLKCVVEHGGIQSIRQTRPRQGALRSRV